MEKTEVTTVIKKSATDDPVRDAVDPKLYDEYRDIWKDVNKLEKVTDFPTQLDCGKREYCIARRQAIVCYYAVGDTERMKKAFIQLSGIA